MQQTDYKTPDFLTDAVAKAEAVEVQQQQARLEAEKRALEAGIEIRQHNAITTARYDMSACEMDIVFALLSLLKKDDKTGTVYRLRVKRLEQMTGRNWNYKQLREATENLIKRVYYIDNKEIFLQVSLLASALYVKGEGVIEMEISEKIRPYLVDLKNNFTSYSLKAAFSLSSKYAKRIYQWASQWKDVGETKTLTLDQFKYMLSLKDPKGKEKEQYKQVSALQKYVLDRAVEQINGCTELKVSYELNKSRGRSYDTIRLYVSTQVPAQLPIEFEETVSDVKLEVARQHLAKLEIVDVALVNTILSERKYIDQLSSFMYKVKTDKIKASSNPGGLFLRIAGLR